MFHANFNFCPFNYKFLIVLVFCSSVTSVTELARGLACLLLELRREVVRSGEVELIGNVLDAAVGSSEQVLGTLQLKVHLIVCRREVGVFLEYAAELAVADAEAGGYLLDGECGLEVLADNFSGTVDDILILGTVLQRL